MKRLYICFFAVVLLLSAFALPTFAYDEGTEEAAETVFSEVVEGAETEEISDGYIEQFFNYVMGSEEMIDKFIAMGDQYSSLKEEGYTFKERVLQLLTPENLIVTVAAAFIIVCGVALFLFRRSFNKSSGIANSAILSLKKQFSEERDDNARFRKMLEEQNETIEALNRKLDAMNKSAENTKKDMERVNKVSVAVATMVKDVFMNSKTIDSSGKNLLLHEYTVAVNESESVFKNDGSKERNVVEREDE